MLLCLYFLTYGVLPQVQAAGKDAPVIVVAHRAGAKVAPENTVAALEQAIRDGVPIAEIDVQQLSDGTLIVMHDSNFKRTTGEDICVWDVEADALKNPGSGQRFFSSIPGRTDPDTGRNACLCQRQDHSDDRTEIYRTGGCTGGKRADSAAGL